MHLPRTFVLRAAVVAVALTAFGFGTAVAGHNGRNSKKETIVGAFVGVPKITLDAEDPILGVQNVNFEGIGTLLGMGEAECTTSDEKYDPITKKCWGHHTLTGDHGDSITIEFESTKVTSDAVLDEYYVPQIVYIGIWADWKITSGTGRYRYAKGTGTLYVDAWAKPTGPLNLEGLGNWAMWGEVACVQPPRCHWGWRRW